MTVAAHYSLFMACRGSGQVTFHLQASGGTDTVPSPTPLVCNNEETGAQQQVDLGQIAKGTNLAFSTEGPDGVDFVVDITADKTVGHPKS
ncbi:hypothetical protein AB1207_22455 [Kineococcus endophyticus]|uniref:Uncharacterized protein n=1 Tax=Kineococcus endophyticus TaxID=1181883 RepID=A0ABV3PCY7_9ACTN